MSRNRAADLRVDRMNMARAGLAGIAGQAQAGAWQGCWSMAICGC